MVVDEQRLLAVGGKRLHGGDGGLIGKDGGDLLHLDGVHEARRVAQELFDERDVPHDFVAGNGDDRLARAPVRAVDDGVPQLAVVDEFGLIAADGDVEVCAPLDEIGKILRRLGVIHEF